MKKSIAPFTVRQEDNKMFVMPNKPTDFDVIFSFMKKVRVAFGKIQKNATNTEMWFEYKTEKQASKKLSYFLISMHLMDKYAK